MARLTKPWSRTERDYLNRYVKADFETGLLYWKENSPNGRYKAGDRLNTSLAGPGGSQYLIFAVTGLVPNKKQKNFKVHHVVWFLATGKQSRLWLDHIDRNKLNNRLSNLRETTPSQNQQNQFKPRTRNTGLTTKGTQKRTHRTTSYWSTIACSGVPVYLGTFRTEREAAEAYDRASIVIHGDYGCRNYPDDTYTPESLEQTRVLLRNSLQKKQAILSGVCI